MFPNRPRMTVVDITPLQKAQTFMENLHLELDELLDSGEPNDSEIEMYALAITDAEDEYERLVDLETDAALSECEDLMEKGLDLW